MPAMDKPKVPKDGLESEVTAKRVVRYLGLMSKERKEFAKIEKKLKDHLKKFMVGKGLPKIIATDGSTAVLEETDRAYWDHEGIRMELGMDEKLYRKRFSNVRTSERLTCRVPK